MTIHPPTQVLRQIQRMDQAAAKMDKAIAAMQLARAATWAANKPLGRKKLPPFGRQWIEAGRRYGPFVICGPGAWGLAERRKHSGYAMVVPSDRDPLDFDWSLLNGRLTILIEAGGFDTKLVERTAFALLAAGVPHVRPIRTVGLDSGLPYCWPSYARDDYVPE